MPTDQARSTAYLLALGWLGACAPGVDDAEATLSETMPTVVRVTWTTPEPTRGFVAFGEDGALDRETPLEAEATTEHEAWLVANPQETELSWQIRGDVESRVERITTGSFRRTPPELIVEGSGQTDFLVAPWFDDQDHLMIVDPQGRVVWYYRDPLPLGTFRVRVSRDGSGIVYSSVLSGGGATRGSSLVRLSWEGERLVQHEIDFLTHDFVELADGTLVSLAAERRGEGEDELEGNKLIAVSPDGTVEDLWSTWDCFDPQTNPSVDPNRPHEWTHANALDYDEGRDAFLVGFRNLGTIAVVDRSTGDCALAIGGTGGTVELRGPQFQFQHQFDWTEDGRLYVFDNQGAAGLVSRVLEFDVDEESGVATVEGQIRAEPDLFTFILGDVHALDDDGLQIFWGDTGLVDRVGPDGSRQWLLAAPEGYRVGFGELHADPGHPLGAE